MYVTDAYVERMLASVQRIRELHTVTAFGDCEHCLWLYPCPTITALSGW